MRLSKRADDADRQRQEARRVHRRADQSLERLAAGILKPQHCSTGCLVERKRARRPGRVEHVPQLIFVNKTVYRSRRRSLRGQRDGQHGAAASVFTRSPLSAEDPLAIPPQYLRAVIRIRGIQRVKHRLSLRRRAPPCIR